MSLRGKFISFMCVLLLLVFISAYYFFTDAKNTELTLVLQADQAKLAAQAANLEGFLEKTVRDVLLLSKLSAIETYLSADISDTGSASDYVVDLQEIFYSLAAANPSYTQVRLLDSNGFERIRINQHNGKRSIVASDALQDKSHRAYFTLTKELARNDVYISPLNYNMEHGVVVLPKQPVIRLAKPIWNSNQFLGVVIINIDATSFFESITQELHGKDQLYVLSKAGNILMQFNLDQNAEAQFVIDHERTLPQYERYAEHIRGTPTANHQNNGNPFTHRIVGIPAIGEGNKFIMVKLLDQEVVFAGARERFRDSLITISMVMVAVFSISLLLFVRHIAERVRRNKRAVEAVAAGNLDEHIDVVSGDEVADVAAGINLMIKELKKRELESERIHDEINTQTDKLRQTNTSLENAKRATLNLLEDLEAEKENVETIVEKRTAELEEERTKLHYVTEHIPSGGMIVDRDLNVVFHNSIIKELLQEPKETKLFKKLITMFPDLDIANNCMACNLIDPISVPEVDHRGNIYELYIQCLPGANDDIEQYFGHLILIRDVTKEKILDRSRKEFVSIASHQLRTPLTSIRLFIEMLINQDIGELNTDQKEYLNNVHVSTLQMIDLVNELLQLSRLESGRTQVKRKSFHLTEYINDLISEMTLIGKVKQCNISCQQIHEGVIEIYSDPDLLRQVFTNLMTNAIRYSKDDTCQLDITVEQTDDHAVKVSFKDHGIGIAKKDQENMFKKFYRSDRARKRHADGSGLGLYVVKHITELLGGNIWFESEADVGTTFYISLPINSDES